MKGWLARWCLCGAESLMVWGFLAFKNKEICWQLPDSFFSDALNQWLKVSSGWVNVVLKCLCLGLPGLGSVSLFCYEGCFEWEGRRNAKINAVMTARIWTVGIVASVSHLFPGRAVPFSYAAIALPSLSCPVFWSFRSDSLPILEMVKTWPLPAAVEVRGRIWVFLVFTSQSLFFSAVEFSMSCSHVMCNCCFSFKFSLALS